jgi:hypothetical protein
MRFARGWIIALVATLFVTASVQAQVLSQMPATALVVVRIKNLQDFSQKIAALATKLGAGEIQGNPMTDPLGFVSKQLKLDKGLNSGGDFGVAYLSPTTQPADATAPPASRQPPLLMFIPTSDYQGLLSNYSDAKTDGGITTATTADGETTYIANWGNYAVYAMDKTLLSVTPGGLIVPDAAAKQMDAQDACVMVNMPAVEAITAPLMDKFRHQILTQAISTLRGNAQFGKYADVIRVAVQSFADFGQKLMDSCNDVTFGLKLDDAGIHATGLIDLKSDSELGQMVAGEPNSSASLLAGLPDASYLFFGGAVSDPKGAAKILSEILDPITPELDKLGDDGKPLEDYIQAIKDAAAAQTAATFGVIAPTGELGTAPLFQFVGTRTGDSKVFAAATAKILTVQATKFTTSPMQATFTPAAKTLDGVTFDQYHLGMDMTAIQNNPQMAMAAQYLTFFYGQDGLNMYSGAVNDTTYLAVGGISDDMISAAIAAAKTGDDPLSKNVGVQDTAAQLPTQRLGVFYVSLDTLLNTIINYAGKFGFEVGVTMPASDPIGMTVAATGSAIEMDGYVPENTLVGVTDVVKKAIGSVMTRNNPGANGGAGGQPVQPGQPANPGGL